MTRRRGFTLVELLIVIIVVAIVASIAVPRIINGWRRGSEARIRANLTLMRNAIDRFRADTGLYPTAVTDLWTATAPASGLDENGNRRPIPPGQFRGPYADWRATSRTIDPSIRITWTYETTPPNVGRLWQNTTQLDSDGKPISSW